MNDLSPEARALLELASGEDSPTREDRVRVRRALAATLATGVISSSAAAAAASKSALGAAAGASGAVAKSTVAVWLAVGVVAGLAGSAAIFMSTPSKTPSTASPAQHDAARAKTATPQAAAAPESSQAAPPATAVRVEPPQAAAVPQSARTAPSAPKASVPAPARAIAPPSTGDVERAASTTDDKAALAPPPPAPPAAPPTVTSLGPETALLESARTALGRGDAPGAIALLERHEREFPAGALVEERLAAKVLALCSLGRREEAARTASRLLRLSPTSPLRARILDSCAYEH